jgi:hypothetical protein
VQLDLGPVQRDLGPVQLDLGPVQLDLGPEQRVLLSRLCKGTHSENVKEAGSWIPLLLEQTRFDKGTSDVHDTRTQKECSVLIVIT